MVEAQVDRFQKELKSLREQGAQQHAHKFDDLDDGVSQLCVHVRVEGCIVEPPERPLKWNRKIVSSSHAVHVAPDFSGRNFSCTVVISDDSPMAVMRERDLFTETFVIERGSAGALAQLLAANKALRISKENSDQEHQAAMKSAVSAAAEAVTSATAAALASQHSQPLHRQPGTMERVKRATVRIGLLDKDTGTIFKVGSGVIINGSCGAFAQVLTCAHNFLDVDHGVPYTLCSIKHRYAILVGCYQDDEHTSIWRYRAELETPNELLLKMVPMGQKGETTLLDLAVLRVDRKIEVNPSAFQGLGKSAPVYTLGPEISQFDSQNSCPLRESGLDLGSTSAVTTGSTLSTAGWSSQRAEKTVFVASDFQVLNKDDGLLKSNVVLESGGSGGGQVNNSGEVIAINSMSMFVARINQGRPNEKIQAEYASWGRSVAELEAGHGLKP